MPRVYLEGLQPQEIGALVALDSEQSAHLGRSLRMAVGDCFWVGDGKGLSYRASIDHFVKQGQLIGKIQEAQVLPDANGLTVLGVGICKQDRFEWMVEKAAELGATSVVPLKTRHSQPHIKLDRCRKIAIQSSALASRPAYLQIEEAQSLERFLERSEFERRTLFSEGAPDWQAQPGLSARQALAIGPEGGFAQTELELAAQQGWQVAGLGPLNLRVETAAIVCLAKTLL